MSKQVTLRRRLILMIAVAIGSAQLLVALTTVWLEATRYAGAKQDILFSEARIMAAAVSRGVATSDRSQIYAALRAMGQVTGTSFIAIDDMAGQQLAALGATENLTSDLVIDLANPTIPPMQLLTSGSIAVHLPIVQSGRVVGHLRLIADASDFKAQLAATMKIAVLSLVLSLAVAGMIAWWMQRAITRPVADLRDAMVRVASDHNYTLAITSSPLKELALLIGGFNAMLAQIRERDERIARSYLELERQVADRTQELRVAKEQAETANAQKSDFLATMSHEIRTPMNGMLVMAELLAQAELPARCQRYAQVIWRSGQSLLAIINDILDLSKIEAGKLELESTRIDIRDLVQTTLDLFSERARSKGLDLAASIAPDVPLAMSGDPVRLAQVLSNFMNNALKFTESGGVRLVVMREAGNDSRLRFSVQDTGIGIAEDKLASVFDAFSQADQSTTRKFGGTGLGLAICRKLVEAMDAEIVLTSRVGEGSVFAFSLSISDGEQYRQATIPADAPPICIEASGCFTPEILADAFTAAGFALVPPGKQAETSAVRITQLGACTSNEFRAHRASGGLSVVVVDPDTDPANLGADGTLTWPIATKELDALIERLIEGRPLTETTSIAGQASNTVFLNLHALVADDTDINCEVAREALGQLGITVDTVSDGAAAVAATQSAFYGVILMDGSMPVMDGFTATRAIRQHEAEHNLPRKPIVALTAHVIGTSSKEWIEAGADAILSKPFTVADLRTTLSRVLGTEPVVLVGPAEVGARPSSQESMPKEDGDSQVLDESVLGDLRAMAAAGQPEFLRRIVTLYIEHAPQALKEVRTHAAARQHEMLAKSAHALKSMSLNMGAKRVAALASDMELEARNAVLPTEAALEQLFGLYDQTVAQLQHETAMNVAA